MRGRGGGGGIKIVLWQGQIVRRVVRQVSQLPATAVSSTDLCGALKTFTLLSSFFHFRRCVNQHWRSTATNNLLRMYMYAFQIHQSEIGCMYSSLIDRLRTIIPRAYNCGTCLKHCGMYTAAICFRDTTVYYGAAVQSAKSPRYYLVPSYQEYSGGKFWKHDDNWHSCRRHADLVVSLVLTHVI